MAGNDISVSQALAVLEEHASSARAHSAIKTLRNEISGEPSKPDGPPSPGQRAAKNAPGSSFGSNASKASAFARMKGGSK